jgi:hypothetical protein
MRVKTMQSELHATEPAEYRERDQENCFDLSAADAVWIGVALLHYSRPSQAQFTNEEIVNSVLKHHLTKATEKSIRQHVLQHCVAESKPQPNRSCMLHATRDSHRRIFHDWEDQPHPARRGAPTHPEWDKLPAQYAYLRQWYEQRRKQNTAAMSSQDPLLDLIGSGSEIWNGKDADAYVAGLRAGWSDAE